MKTKRIRENSLAAFYAGQRDLFSKREQQILSAFAGIGIATDRDICNLLGFPDLNAVRPRITELIRDGVIEETGSQQCLITKKTVRVCRIVASNKQRELNLFGGAA
jgi:predicted transcriptional regulator